jgi:SAM-dependent methyltransferase
MKKQTDKLYEAIADPIILELIRKHFPEVKTVLDLGCGSGGNAAYLKAVGFDVTGITISAKEAQVTSSICPVVVFDLNEGLPSEIKRGNFDVILAAHLLEHIFYPVNLLRDIMNVCRDGLIVIIPNLLYWRNRVKMLFGIFEYADLGIMDYTHSRWYTFKTIQELLELYGFSVVSATAEGDVFNINIPLSRSLNKLLVRLFPGLFGFQFYIVAIKPKV